ncbi:outer membrane protein [Helicobacter salomonis]|uniref:outer membrane protein n=1 Tax=Helicobacter salomonis TaxID=56878 RepID=UPI001315278E|nr:outer membrane protein [Helicobacter salomonis]
MSSYKHFAFSLSTALSAPFLNADVPDVDKDGFQRTDVIYCCTPDGKSFPKPPIWARPDFNPTPNKPNVQKPQKTPTFLPQNPSTQNTPKPPIIQVPKPQNPMPPSVQTPSNPNTTATAPQPNTGGNAAQGKVPHNPSAQGKMPPQQPSIGNKGAGDNSAQNTPKPPIIQVPKPQNPMPPSVQTPSNPNTTATAPQPNTGGNAAQGKVPHNPSAQGKMPPQQPSIGNKGAGDNSAQNTGPQTGNSAPSLASKTYLQALIDGDSVQGAVGGYQADQENTLQVNTRALLTLVKNSGADDAAAVSSLVAGTNKFFSEVSGNPNITQNLKDTFKGFYSLASTTSHDVAGLQANLSQLIAQVEQLQRSLLNTLATTAIHAQRPDGLLASTPPENLSPQSRQAKGKAIQDLGTLLAYLQATQSKLKTYASNNPSLLALSSVATTLSTMRSGQVNGNLYGVNAQLGYKQFFGKKKRVGLRYYGSFSYQYGALIGSTPLSNVVYGAGMDALYNFYESAKGHYTTGVFVGFMLAGSTWLLKNAHAYQTLARFMKDQNWQVSQHTTYFQIPLNIGFRSNLSKHHGFEVGLRIPLLMDSYLKGTRGEQSLDISYKRNVSVFVNYVYSL